MNAPHLITPADIDRIREHWTISRDITHSHDCWRWHPACVIAQLCNALDEHRTSLGAIHRCARRWLAHAPSDGPERPALLALIEECERVLPELGEWTMPS